MVDERALCAAFLLVLLPVLLVIALPIRIDSRGPVFFRQKRYGFNNQVIEIFKFLTMYLDAGTGESVAQATRDDPRVTRIYHCLRSSSLDELPQLFNVLRGEMSIMGPRPHVVPHNDHYTRIINGYAQRHRVKPGITGWAQVNAWRGETEVVEKMRRRVECDLYYIENWSLEFDLRIILRTALVFWNDKSAY
jgi:lipopolysaccharide/colanic/teichoic acid biosynthesis glycosyltransferase